METNTKASWISTRRDAVDALCKNVIGRAPSSTSSDEVIKKVAYAVHKLCKDMEVGFAIRPIEDDRNRSYYLQYILDHCGELLKSNYAMQVREGSLAGAIAVLTQAVVDLKIGVEAA